MNATTWRRMAAAGALTAALVLANVALADRPAGAAAPAAEAPAAVIPAAATPAPAPTAARAASKADDILRALAERLLDEAERQHVVNRRMDAAVGAFAALVADLASNDLLAQGRGPTMKRFGQVLAILATRHVPNAERYLQQARKQLAELRPNLDGADGEIKVILGMLDELLKKAERTSATDDLLTRLRLIIRNEENLNAQTKEWGKLLMQKPAEAEAPRQELRDRQRQIAATARQFQSALDETARQEADPSRQANLAKARDAMDKARPDRKLDKAAEDINTKKPVAAVTKQAEAIEALKALEKILEADSLPSQLEDMKASYQELEELLARQEKLTEQTRQTPREEFARKNQDLQTDQHDIRRDLQNTSAQMPEAVDPQVAEPLRQADQDMQQATEKMQQDQQPAAVQQQEQAENQLKKAIKKLGDQIAEAESQLEDTNEQNELAEQLEQEAQQAESLAQRQQQLMQTTMETAPMQLAQLAEPQGTLGEEATELSQQAPQAAQPLEQAAGEMHQATQHLEQGQKADAAQHQQAAIAALRQAATALHQAARNPNHRPTPMARTRRPQEKGSRDFGRQKPGGRGVDDKRLWEHLNPKQREALRQNFARDLPLEYRELLEDYYEALSK